MFKVEIVQIKDNFHEYVIRHVESIIIAISDIIIVYEEKDFILVVVGGMVALRRGRGKEKK